MPACSVFLINNIYWLNQEKVSLSHRTIDSVSCSDEKRFSGAWHSGGRCLISSQCHIDRKIVKTFRCTLLDRIYQILRSPKRIDCLLYVYWRILRDGMFWFQKSQNSLINWYLWVISSHIAMRKQRHHVMHFKWYFHEEPSPCFLLFPGVFCLFLHASTIIFPITAK